MVDLSSNDWHCFQMTIHTKSAIGISGKCHYRVQWSFQRLALALVFCGFVMPSIAIAVGTWTPLVNQAPSGIVSMNLLSDGTVMCQDIGGSANNWYRLTPDSHGSYVNGTWTQIASMHDGRNAYATQVLTNGQVFVAGGESGGGASSAEVYDPILNSWTMCPGSGCLFSDSISDILPNGNVLISPVGPTNGGETMIFTPSSNAWSAGPQLFRGYYEDEASWVKLPDNSILCIDSPGSGGTGTNSERYIPALNQWINDANVPVNIYGGIFEMGAAILLPNGNAFFLGAGGTNAIYIPSGSTNMGTWVAGPVTPDGQISSDTPAAMMVNGKVLCMVSPYQTSGPPSSFYEYDPVANSFTVTGNPGNSTYYTQNCRLLDLPDGTLLFSYGGSQLYDYQPDGAPLTAGRPSIINITTNFYRSYSLTGKLLNGITEGAGYGDDAQMNSNYPLVRMTNNVTGKVYYARTYNWNCTGVMTGTNIVTTEFTAPQNLPTGSYSLVIEANGNCSQPVPFNFTPDSLSISVPSGFVSSGPVGGPFAPSVQAYFLNNIATSPLNWTLINTSAWLNVSETGGILAAGGQSTMIVSVSSTATNLPAGIYTTSIWFSNLNSRAIQSIPFQLGINPLLQNGGFEYGSFADWDLSGDRGNSVTAGNYNGIGGTINSAHSGNFSAFLGLNGSVGYLSQTLSTVPGLSYLLSFYVNSTAGIGSSNELAVSWDGLSLFDQQNFATAGWTNLQFIVQATSDNTDLEFAFANETNYFILDDATLSSLPPNLLIASQPQSVIIPVGYSADLTVLAGGPPPLTYQWQKNGIALSDSGDISGSTTATLSVGNAIVADGGNYRAIVYSGSISVTSQLASLSVIGISPNCAVSAPEGLISWWAGNYTATDSAGTNNGTLENGVTYVPGEVQYAFGLNGSGSYVSIPDSASWAFSTNAFSIELWANTSSTANNQAMLAYDAGGGSQNKWIFWLNNNNLQLHINGPQIGANYITSGSTVINTNKWYHIVLTRQANTFSFYLNGSLLSTSISSVSIPAASVPLTLGQAEGGFFFDGMLDEIRIYNRAISSNEIQAIYQAGTNGMCAPTPLIFLGAPNFNNKNGVILNASLRSSQTYHIQSVTNLAFTNWIDLTNFTAGTSPTFHFTNTPPTNALQEFYRIVSP